MATDADFEIGLRWDRDRGAFDVNLRFEILGTSTEVWDNADSLHIDVDRLASLSANETKYGVALTEMLFGPEDIKSFYQKVRKYTEGQDLKLHVRLFLQGPQRFHAVRWESLRDPETDSPLATRSDVLFSRYLNSPDWRPIPALPRHQLKSLLVVAGPTNVERYAPSSRPLAPVQVEQELERARQALASTDRMELPRGKATLLNLLQVLDNDDIDILYLVCHGALIEDVPRLLLEDADGKADFVDGRRLVDRLSELRRRPTVVMLCSCQSAGADTEAWTDDEGELSALGPRMANAGIAAVVAMQGNVSMITADVFAPAFFVGLAEHGHLDEAMAAARRKIIERSDWWVPVMFSRVRSGRPYYTPEFAERSSETWTDLELEAKTGRFTPVLGPGLADGILGSRQEVASQWVQRYQMPIAPQNQGDLAVVAQYLRVHHTVGRVRTQFQEYVADELKRRAAANVDDPIWQLSDGFGSDGPLDPETTVETILEIGRRLRRSDPGDPYRVAASFPVPVYVTTGWTDLLQEALRDRTPPKEPVTATFPWRETDVMESLAEAAPTVERPLVFHLFGRLPDVESLVLTEDDCFAWLDAWSKRSKDIPSVVQKALTLRSLLFLGFQIGDWDFRVIFQGIKSFGGSTLIRENPHVAVQISPENPTLVEPEAAQRYLESYFGVDNVNIFWGNTRRFLDDFRQRTGLET